MIKKLADQIMSRSQRWCSGEVQSSCDDLSSPVAVMLRAALEKLVVAEVRD
jgi:hypothetical protein